MARLFKKHITRYRLADGKAVPRGTLGATKSKEQSSNWYGEYRDALGVKKTVPLCRDKSAATSMLHNLEVRAERQAAGRIDEYDEHGKQPLMEHLDAFRHHL